MTKSDIVRGCTQKTSAV